MIEWVQPIRSAITVTGIVGQSRTKFRICGSTGSTNDRFAGCSYGGSCSATNADRIVFHASPHDQIALTMPRDGTILRLGRTLRQDDIDIDTDMAFGLKA